MINQSFRQSFVTNTGSLLAQGSTVENLAVGQIGIIDAATNLAVTAPTYATTKAFKFVWGTPDIDTGLWGGVPNENEYSKLVKGKLITGFRAKAAARPQSQIVSIGWTGDVSDTATLSASAGDVKFLYLNFTGSAIDKLFSKQGLIRQYAVDTSCWTDTSDCAEGCQGIDPCRLAEEFAKQISVDTIGSFPLSRLINVKAVTECSLTGGVECYVFEVSICDDGSDAALGFVQAQYAGYVVTRSGRVGANSTYTLTKDTIGLPTALSNAGLFFIPDCPVCPAGYTAVTSKFVYTVTREDAGDAGALTQIETDYSIAGAETAVRTHYEFGTSTYIIASSTAQTASGTDVLVLLGNSRHSCILTTPTTTAWVLTETLYKYPKVYRLTIADTLCGDDRLAELQAAYPDLVVTLVDADGTCVHTYETTNYSQCVPIDCGVENLNWTRPANFEGSQWEVYTTPGAIDTALRSGIRIEVAFVNRVTGECTFDHFPAWDYDTVFVNASSFNPDWNASNCENEFKVRQIQGFKPPIGSGSQVRAIEQESKGYDLRTRSFNPVVREIEGYSFQADPNKYYDEYVIEYKFQYKVGGWSNQYEDSYHQSIFVPEGAGANIEAALNGYIQSSAIQIESVSI